MLFKLLRQMTICFPAQNILMALYQECLFSSSFIDEAQRKKRPVHSNLLIANPLAESRIEIADSFSLGSQEAADGFTLPVTATNTERSSQDSHILAQEVSHDATDVQNQSTSTTEVPSTMNDSDSPAGFVHASGEESKTAAV
jgi:hypothetical protein